MIDIISLSIAIGAVLVGILSHIRHSECFGIKIDTRTPKNTPPSSPQIIDANLKSSIDDFLPQKKSSTFYSESQPLLQNSPAILQPSMPINIPPRPKNKKNYL